VARECMARDIALAGQCARCPNACAKAALDPREIGSWIRKQLLKALISLANTKIDYNSQAESEATAIATVEMPMSHTGEWI
jgi:hypothetical protein